MQGSTFEAGRPFPLRGLHGRSREVRCRTDPALRGASAVLIGRRSPCKPPRSPSLVVLTRPQHEADPGRSAGRGAARGRLPRRGAGAPRERRRRPAPPRPGRGPSLLRPALRPAGLLRARGGDEVQGRFASSPSRPTAISSAVTRTGTRTRRYRDRTATVPRPRARPRSSTGRAPEATTARTATSTATSKVLRPGRTGCAPVRLRG